MLPYQCHSLAPESSARPETMAMAAVSFVFVIVLCLMIRQHGLDASPAKADAADYWGAAAFRSTFEVS
jgi:hypothetical protein